MLNTNGITQSIDRAYTGFKEKYGSVGYAAVLERQYNKWLPLTAGHIAPEISGYNLSNELVRLSDFKGKVVYVDVWATWCGPCVAEIPAAKALQEKFKNDSDVVFMNVSVDTNKKEWRDKVDADKTWGGTHVIDTAIVIFKSYKINSIPEYILVDKAGNIFNSRAPEPSSEEMEKIINSLRQSRIE